MTITSTDTPITPTSIPATKPTGQSEAWNVARQPTRRILANGPSRGAEASWLHCQPPQKGFVIDAFCSARRHRTTIARRRDFSHSTASLAFGSVIA